MAVTHHFVDASDLSKGGRWAAHYGETICSWKWDPDARAITVWYGSQGTRHDLSALDPQELDAAKLAKRLPRMALDAAEKLRGTKFGG